MSVRWDTVVDRSTVDIGRISAPPVLRTVANQDGGLIDIHVQLFGVLAYLTAERSIRLSLPATTTVAGVLAVLGERLGEDFLAHIEDQSGALRRYCRLFVGGYLVEDLQTPLQATADPSEIDIIMLISPEGG